jgi:hypothetical protein
LGEVDNRLFLRLAHGPLLGFMRRRNKAKIAEGLTGRTVPSEHLYWHASNVHGPEWAVDYLDSAGCDCTPEEINFVDWVFNASPALKERAEMMALHKQITYERNAEKRTIHVQRSLDFIDRITDTLSRKMVLKVKNRWGGNIWLWHPEGFQRPKAQLSSGKRQR